MESVGENTATEIKQLGGENAADFGPENQAPEIRKLFTYIESQRARYITTLREAVGIRSVSGWPHARSESIRMIQWTATKLEALGFTVDIRKVGDETLPDGNIVPFPPIILATLGDSPEKKTLMIYGHVDVSAATFEEGWESDPFVLIDYHGALFGRGSADNKGPLLGWIHAIEAYQKNEMEMPVNIKFVIEGMQERGSQGLKTLLEASEAFVTDISSVVVSDGSWLGKEKPCLAYGLRGLLYFFVEVESGTKDLHSGVYGGCLRESMPDLLFLLNSLVDAAGNILIPGIQDEVCPISVDEEEVYDTIEFLPEEFRVDAGINTLSETEKVKLLMKRWRLPTLSIHGIQGCFSTPGALTVIPRKVIGKFSIRLVPNQKVEEVEKLVTDYVNSKWAERGSPNTMLIYTASDGFPSWTSNPLHENYLAARRATAMVYGQFPDLIRDGGHMGNIWTLQDITKQNILLLPMGAADDKTHSENEKLDSRNYIEGTKLMAAYFYEYGNIPPAEQ